MSVSGESPHGKSQWRSLLLQVLALAVIVAPAILVILQVKEYLVNMPHYDDFTFLEDWLKYKQGDLTWSELFGVHLEHRVTVPRLISLALHIMGGADLRWQNGLTLLLLLGSLWNLIALWRTTTGATVRASWFPLLLISTVLFCGVQWQTLLWPILFEIVVPIYCLTLLVRLWASQMGSGKVMAVSILLCAICMLCFANGPVILCLPPLCLWLQRPYEPAARRWKLFGAWLLSAALGLTLYFTNFHNTVPTQFAYWYGKDMTAADTLKAFLMDPNSTLGAKAMKAFDFTTAVLGSHLSRGLHWNNLFLAQWMGLFSVALFAAGLVWVLIKWRDKELLRNAAPWIILGLFSGGTALLITLGRVSRTVSGSIAIIPRYMTHSVPLTIALIALVWILGHRLAPRWRTLGGALGGAFLMLMTVEWVYGTQRMELWHNARLQGKALLMFSKVFEPYEYLGQVSGIGDYGADIMTKLDNYGQSPVPLLKSRLLSQFHVSNLKLRHRQSGFESLHLTKDGGLEAEGYAELPGQRPADLILFTTTNSEGAEEIFGLKYLLRFPGTYWNSATIKDDDWSAILPVKADYSARWDGPMFVYKRQIPPTGSVIKAWALDVEKGYVYLIADHRTSPDPLPPVAPRPVDEGSKKE